MQQLHDLSSIQCTKFEEDSMRVVIPTVNAVGSSSGYRLMFDIPGMVADSIKLEAEDGSLIISARVGRLQADFSAKEYRACATEFRYEYAIPEDASLERIEADFESGLLIVFLPRINQSDPGLLRRFVQ